MDQNEIHAYLRSPEKPELRYFAHAVAKDTSDLASVLLYDLYIRITRQKKPPIPGWTFDSARKFAEKHLYASEPGIRKAFLALEETHLVKIDKTGTKNRKGYDRKWWFALTKEGRAQANQRRIRFEPTVAAALDIPKAVLLENFRYRYHASGEKPVSLKPNELDLPYSEKTIGRHLQELVAEGILRAVEDENHVYTIPTEAVIDWRASRAPLIVPINALLPQIPLGSCGLLVGHSGTGKTSYSSFAALQFAVAGMKTLYLSLEEPKRNIEQRMTASETGVNYTELHRGDGATVAEAMEVFGEHQERVKMLKQNLKIEDLSANQHSLGCSGVRKAIDQVIADGFVPEVIFVDQLEFIGGEAKIATVMPERCDDEAGQIPAKVETPSGEAALSASEIAVQTLRQTLPDPRYCLWVLHQATGAQRESFSINGIVGGTKIAGYFDYVVGIGRARSDAKTLKVFSLSAKLPFVSDVETHFAHMRFMPKLRVDKSKGPPL